MEKKKTLYLLDGHALVYRAHYAFISRPLINSKGLNTSAITGFVRFLWDVLQRDEVSHVGVAFDLSGKTFRNDIYPEYKANRDAQPEDITIALPYIRDIIDAFKVPIITFENYEADDVIGTIAKRAEQDGYTVYMVTPDKDYAQLVSEQIYMYRPARQGNDPEILGVDEILEKWDIARVDQVIDVLGLQGDSVDNIPGVPGIGPKTAVSLLKKFPSVEDILKNTDQLKGKQKERLEEFGEQALLSKELATIVTDVPIELDLDSLVIEDMDRDKLLALFKELEFRTLAQRILGPVTPVQTSLFGDTKPETSSQQKSFNIHEDKKTLADVSHSYHLLRTEKEVTDLVARLENCAAFAFDTETTGLDPMEAEILGMSIAMKAGEAYYISLKEDSEKGLLEHFKAVFENEKIAKYGQNIKYDALMIRRYGLDLKGKLYDSMILHYLLHPELRHNMDYLAETYLDYKPISITTLIGKKGKKQRNMADIDPVDVCDYACEDADITWQLVEHFLPLLKKEQLEDLYWNIEEPLIKVLVDLEFEGIKLDSNYLKNYSQELALSIDKVEKEIYQEAGLNFNISSPKQVGQVLFEHLNIPYRWKKTKTGQYSTDEEKMSELAKSHDIVAKILSFRALAKLRSTYVDALPKMVNPSTGRIHSSFNQALAATGRLSSNNPNLQNIPIRTEEGRRVREAFVPRDENHVLLAADYSQIELRLIAEISGDEAMQEAFIKNQDIHRATAAKVYDVPYVEVNRDQRRNAKTVNFSIIYGAGATNLSRQLDIPRKEASGLISAYFEQYAGLKKYMDDTVAFARENGYVGTKLGRKRQLRDINSRNRLAASGAERIAINTPIQGTAADMIKIAMINIHKWLEDEDLRTKMILQVHDELVFDVPKDELDYVRPRIEELMRNALDDLSIPILVESDTGENWLEAH